MAMKMTLKVSIQEHNLVIIIAVLDHKKVLFWT